MWIRNRVRGIIRQGPLFRRRIIFRLLFMITLRVEKLSSNAKSTWKIITLIIKRSCFYMSIQFKK